MARWAIAYDLDVGGMKAGGYTRSEVTLFYNRVRDALKQNGFEKFSQYSLYTSHGENTLTNAFQACNALSRFSDRKFIKRLQLFRVEDLNDLLPLVNSGKESSSVDPIEEAIQLTFPEVADEDSSVRAVAT